MRKNMVMDLIYRGFIYAANYSESHYWDIEELTSTKFAVYNRFGEYGSLDMSREYMELSPLK